MYQTARQLASQNVVIILSLGQLCRGSSGRQRWWQQLRRVVAACQANQSGIYQVELLQWLPGQRYTWSRQVNIWLNFWFWSWLARWGAETQQCWLWVFYPALADWLQLFGQWWIHYDCVDWHTSLDPVLSRKVASQRRALLAHADSVTCLHQQVQAKLQALTAVPVAIVPLGSDLVSWAAATGSKSELWAGVKQLVDRLKQERGPIVGFFGGVSARLDLGLIESTRRHLPDWRFVFVGPRGQDENVSLAPAVEARLEKILLQPNVIWVPPLPRSGLRLVMECCTVLWIPYDSSLEFNYSAFPMKVAEYLQTSRPVVSTALPALQTVPGVIVVDAAAAMPQVLRQQQQRHVTATAQRQRQRWVRQQSWSAKLDAVDAYLQRVLPSA